MKKILILLAIFLLCLVASAEVFELTFGTGIKRNVLEVHATTGAPSVGAKYYFTQTSVSKNVGDAFAVSDINTNGIITFVELENIGGCTWTAIVDGNNVSLSALNGRSVFVGQTVKWAVEPNSVTVQRCRLRYDMNAS